MAVPGVGRTRSAPGKEREKQKGAPLQHIPLCLESGDVSIFFNLKNILNSKDNHYFFNWRM
ncbi:hypothetical protein DESPIGER_1648 [Desulfovibrio piger]|uniref:Uncharacterized protein n=1 Tax=Desulfovibrio piger TaxID=901 RepID=A0A1K1LFH7_9BACT|nr:hypothetical protein DESPIGER_1648 [Desulfovibrio piger]